MEKFLEHIQEAERTIHGVDYLTYVTFPIIKDKRLLIKILTETKRAIVNCINAILQYEHFYKRIYLYENAKENFRTFVDKCAPRYNITRQELSSVMELFDILEKDKDSQMEFLKENKMIILSENMNAKVVDIERIKFFLFLAKNILKKTKELFTKKI